MQEQAPVIDTVDLEILMHRDAHFGSNFEVMLEYYEQEGVGAMPDFTIEEIKKLKNLEEKMGKDLSETLLPEQAKNIVTESKNLYEHLREVFLQPETDPSSLLVSDLILSEEENPEKEMQALIEKGSDIVPVLIHLLSSPSLYDPLFPGYGRSPIFAAKCLAKIQDERAIPPLFEAMGQENFFTDEEIIKALCSFGDKAKSFLIKVLKQEPFSKANEHAAIVLNSLPDDPEIAVTCLELLEKEESLKKPMFASYLIFSCSGLTDVTEQQRFITISKKEDLPKELFDEMNIIIRNWKRPE
jgi:hypothetical protein